MPVLHRPVEPAGVKRTKVGTAPNALVSDDLKLTYHSRRMEWLDAAFRSSNPGLSDL
jgi:hypothetical protein